MPGFDGTGPRGLGPMTGGGRGFCNPNFAGMRGPYMGYPYGAPYGGGASFAGYPYGSYPYSPYQAYPHGGFGMGRGMGRGFGMGRGMGRGRRFGW
jgi:hypothetical protein